jgi:hypothetical protein
LINDCREFFVRPFVDSLVEIDFFYTSLPVLFSSSYPQCKKSIHKTQVFTKLFTDILLEIKTKSLFFHFHFPSILVNLILKYIRLGVIFYEKNIVHKKIKKGKKSEKISDTLDKKDEKLKFRDMFLKFLKRKKFLKKIINNWPLLFCFIITKNLSYITWCYSSSSTIFFFAFYPLLSLSSLLISYISLIMCDHILNILKHYSSLLGIFKTNDCFCLSLLSTSSRIKSVSLSKCSTTSQLPSLSTISRNDRNLSDVALYQLNRYSSLVSFSRMSLISSLLEFFSHITSKLLNVPSTLAPLSSPYSSNYILHIAASEGWCYCLAYVLSFLYCNHSYMELAYYYFKLINSFPHKYLIHENSTSYVVFVFPSSSFSTLWNRWSHPSIKIPFSKDNLPFSHISCVSSEMSRNSSAFPSTNFSFFPLSILPKTPSDSIKLGIYCLRFAYPSTTEKVLNQYFLSKFLTTSNLHHSQNYFLYLSLVESTTSNFSFSSPCLTEEKQKTELFQFASNLILHLSFFHNIKFQNTDFIHYSYYLLLYYSSSKNWKCIIKIPSSQNPRVYSHSFPFNLITSPTNNSHVFSTPSSQNSNLNYSISPSTWNLLQATTKSKTSQHKSPPYSLISPSFENPPSTPSVSLEDSPKYKTTFFSSTSIFENNNEIDDINVLVLVQQLIFFALLRAYSSLDSELSSKLLFPPTCTLSLESRCFLEGLLRLFVLFPFSYPCSPSQSIYNIFSIPFSEFQFLFEPELNNSLSLSASQSSPSSFSSTSTSELTSIFSYFSFPNKNLENVSLDPKYPSLFPVEDYSRKSKYLQTCSDISYPFLYQYRDNWMNKLKKINTLPDGKINSFSLLIPIVNVSSEIDSYLYKKSSFIDNNYKNLGLVDEDSLNSFNAFSDNNKIDKNIDDNSNDEVGDINSNSEQFGENESFTDEGYNLKYDCYKSNLRNLNDSDLNCEGILRAEEVEEGTNVNSTSVHQILNNYPHVSWFVLPELENVKSMCINIMNNLGMSSTSFSSIKNFFIQSPELEYVSGKKAGKEFFEKIEKEGLFNNYIYRNENEFIDSENFENTQEKENNIIINDDCDDSDYENDYENKKLSDSFEKKIFADEKSSPIKPHNNIIDSSSSPFLAASASYSLFPSKASLPLPEKKFDVDISNIFSSNPISLKKSCHGSLTSLTNINSNFQYNVSSPRIKPNLTLEIIPSSLQCVSDPSTITVAVSPLSPLSFVSSPTAMSPISPISPLKVNSSFNYIPQINSPSSVESPKPVSSLSPTIFHHSPILSSTSSSVYVSKSFSATSFLKKSNAAVNSNVLKNKLITTSPLSTNKPIDFYFGAKKFIGMYLISMYSVFIFAHTQKSLILREDKKNIWKMKNKKFENKKNNNKENVFQNIELKTFRNDLVIDEYISSLQNKNRDYNTKENNILQNNKLFLKSYNSFPWNYFHSPVSDVLFYYNNYKNIK